MRYAEGEVEMITYSMKSLERMRNDLTYVNVFDIFLGHGERPAIEYKLKGNIVKISYGELENPVKHVADNIIKRLENVEKDRFIALKLDNCPEWPIIFWGIMMAGYKPFLIDYRHNEQLTQFFIDQTEACAIIAVQKENDIANTIQILADELILCDKATLYEIAKRPLSKEGTPSERIRSYKWADEVALCTSGTTSTAKVYTYDGNAIGNQIMSAEHIVKTNERILSDRIIKNLAFLPLHHIFGFLASYLWISFFASSTVFPDGKAPSALLAACREHEVTHIMAVPLLINNIVSGIRRKLSKESKLKQIGFKTMCEISLLAQRISPEKGIELAKKMFKRSVLQNLIGTDLDVIICGGGHVLPDSLKVINAIGYYTVCGFGMTEVGISSLNLMYSAKSRLSGCVGVPVRSIEYKIVPFRNDEENTVCNVGELQMRGKSVHSGRMLDGKKTSAQLDEDGWFASGDIGRIENGALYIEGRLKEVIINESGENVYPDEIEDHFTSLEGINQFTVMGVKKDQGSIYENISLVMETGNDINNKAYIESLLTSINAKNNTLPVFKKVNTVLITNEPLPLSNGIKVKRSEIKRQLESGIENSKYIRLK